MKAKFDIITADQAAARRHHFANGGTPAMWRGRAATLDGAKSKARQNKTACRSKRWED